MPRTTHAYPFEEKVWHFATNLCQRLVGAHHHTFVMVLNSEGEVQTLHFKCPEEDWYQFTGRLTKANTPHLFYDPFDAPEYAWLDWHQIDRPWMERLMGAPFVENDFIKMRTRGEALDPPNQFPTSWGVMF